MPEVVTVPMRSEPEQLPLVLHTLILDTYVESNETLRLKLVLIAACAVNASESAELAVGVYEAPEAYELPPYVHVQV